MKYLKKFENHSAYAAAESGLILPNVSLCAQEGEVHYKPIVPPSRVIVATLNIETTSNPTVLCYGNAWTDVESVLVTRPNGTTYEITYNDLVQYDPYGESDPFMGYQFDVTGNHTLEYTLNQNVTEINNPNMFDTCHSLINVEIPNCITSIDRMFSFCDQLATVVVPNTVTSFGASGGVFWECPSLSSLTMLSTTPPTNDSNVTPFDCLAECTIPNIYVPSESVNAYKAAEGWSYYADKIFPIPSA